MSRSGYQVTSPKSEEYNCFAWAVEENDRWWQPIPGEQFYWPDGVPQEETLEAYVQAYQTLGYERASNEILETGYQKIGVRSLLRKDGDVRYASGRLHQSYSLHPKIYICGISDECSFKWYIIDQKLNV